MAQSELVTGAATPREVYEKVYDAGFQYTLPGCIWYL